MAVIRPFRTGFAATFKHIVRKPITVNCCEEACPMGEIFMGKDYELAVYSKDDFVWGKVDLLVPPAEGR